MAYLPVLDDLTQPQIIPPPHCAFCQYDGDERTYRLASDIKGKREYLCNLCDEQNWNKNVDTAGPDGRIHGSGTRQRRSVGR